MPTKIDELVKSLKRDGKVKSSSCKARKSGGRVPRNEAHLQVRRND